VIVPDGTGSSFHSLPGARTIGAAFPILGDNYEGRRSNFHRAIANRSQKAGIVPRRGVGVGAWKSVAFLRREEIRSVR